MQLVTIRLPYWMLEAIDYLAHEVLKAKRSETIRKLLLNALKKYVNYLPPELARMVMLYAR